MVPRSTLTSIDDGTGCRIPAAIDDPAVPDEIPDEIPNQIGDGVEQALAAIGFVHSRAPRHAGGGARSGARACAQLPQGEATALD
ncbi:MAG: hypothetical protein WAM94_19365, partial [Chromatiaceae bacterium]